MPREYIEFDDTLVDRNGDLRLDVLNRLIDKQASGWEIWCSTKRRGDELQIALSACHEHGMDFDGVDLYE